MWKVYYWIYLVLMVLGLFSLIAFAPLTIADLVSVVINIFIFLSIHAYVFKKKILTPLYWKIIFWITVISFSLSLLDMYALPEGYLEAALPFLNSNIPATDGSNLFSILITLPAVYCLYKLSYKSSTK